MKYFTKELWLDFQDEKNFKEMNQIWAKKVKLYRRQLSKLENRMTKKAFNFFKNISLHDSVVSQIIFKNNIGLKKINPDIKRQIIPTSIELHIINWENQYFRLIYEKVINFIIDFPSNDLLFYNICSGIDDWGYDELTSFNDDYLMHEILFASGSTIKIIFNKFRYENKKL